MASLGAWTSCGRQYNDDMTIGLPSSSFPSSSAITLAGDPSSESVTGAIRGSDLAPAPRAVDRAEISALGYRMRDQAEAAQSVTDTAEAQRQPSAEVNPSDQDEESGFDQTEDLRGLSEDELREVKEMAQRDREVRQHEMAHLAAAGRYARGGMSLRLERGPDGRSYAVAGSVGIDSGPETDPQRTMAKMQQVRRAALAPAQPSTQDRMVAAQAALRERAARVAYMQEQAEELSARHEAHSSTPPAITIAAASAAGATTGQLQQPGVDFVV